MGDKGQQLIFSYKTCSTLIFFSFLPVQKSAFQSFSHSPLPRHSIPQLRFEEGGERVWGPIWFLKQRKDVKFDSAKKKKGGFGKQ